ncbi:MAG: hypothetical protein ACWGSD_20655 [Thermodesulfobacteriota bacterium]
MTAAPLLAASQRIEMDHIRGEAGRGNRFEPEHLRLKGMNLTILINRILHVGLGVFGAGTIL